MSKIYFPQVIYDSICELPKGIKEEISFAMLKYVFENEVIDFKNEHNKRLFNIIKSPIDRKNNDIDKDYLYIIKCFNDNEVFYKYGTTNHKDIDNRFGYYNSTMPYNYESIYHFEKDEIFNPIEKEKTIKVFLKDKRYVPLIKFGGYTECFDLGELNNVLDIIGYE